MIRTAAQKLASKYMKKANPNLELHVYDFDMTLFKSPEPPAWWNTKKDGYWYSIVDSLGRPFLPDSPTGSEFWINEVVSQAQSSISNRNVWSVLCTGRIDTPPMRYRVSEILASKGLDFDEAFLAEGKGATARYKAKVVHNTLRKLPQVRCVQMWDDDADNLRVVGAYCAKVGVDFIPHPVQGYSPYEPDASQEEYLLLKKEWK
jgi:hypothetical protein